MKLERVHDVLMNQCARCAALPGALCTGRRGNRRPHNERRSAERLVRELAKRRRYVDSVTTSYGPLVSSPACEHCDGETSRWVRNDPLRGWVCPLCDDALDAMSQEDAELATDGTAEPAKP